MGRDDLALGENHVSAVQEGEGSMGLPVSARFASFPAPVKLTPPVSQHLLPLYPLPPKVPLAP